MEQIQQAEKALNDPSIRDGFRQERVRDDREDAAEVRERKRHYREIQRLHSLMPKAR